MHIANEIARGRNPLSCCGSRCAASWRQRRREGLHAHRASRRHPDLGILAAIALPTFLGQQKKAQDSVAKSDARNAVAQIESCLADAVEADAGDCGAKATNDGLVPLKLVADTSPTLTGGVPAYAVVATSKSGGTFTITKTAAGVTTYTSNPADAKWNAT